MVTGLNRNLMWRDDLKHAGMVVTLGMMLFDSLVGPDGHFKEGTMETY